MPVFEDQTGRRILLSKTPRRIISLVPSQTELLFDLGLDQEVIGITKFCVHPAEWFQTKTRVGGTKKVNIEKIYRLQPDLIIANKEENAKEQIQELETHFPVWVTDVKNLEDAWSMMADIGKLVDKREMASEIIIRAKTNFSQLETSPDYYRSPKPKTCYLIWRNPYMTIGGDTFIHSTMQAAGFENIFHESTRYPIIGIEELISRSPDLVLLPSEPFPFKQSHIDELGPKLPGTKFTLVDGEMFSWYGSRLLKATEYFFNLQKQLFP